MRFDSIDIDAFGALRGMRIERLGGRLNVIYGPNGAGKTTLLQFLRGLFCGFAGARKLGLLPVSGGEPAGGSVEGHWDKDTCRFRRQANAVADNPLRITLVRNGLPSTDPGMTADRLPTAQIPLLFTVGYAEAHAVDKLVRMAIADGIDLVTGDGASGRPAAASQYDRDQAELARSVRDRIARLSEQRRSLLAEWQQLRTQYDERTRIIREQHRERQADESRRWRQRVDWLHAELQAAESDLREAEELAWRRDDRHRLSPRKQAPLLRLRRAPATDHIEVSHREELTVIDQRVAEARCQLGNIARERLDVNLRAARIAGSPELPTGDFLDRLRKSLSAIEDELLELQDDADRLDAAHGRREYVCGAWSSAARTVVDDVRRRLYGTCECISLFELQHLQSQLDKEAACLDRHEQSLRVELQSLEEQRQRLSAGMGHAAASTGPVPREAAQDLCRCREHHPQETRRTSVKTGESAREVRPESTANDAGPTPAMLLRLGQRRTGLRDDLERARGEWRNVRKHSSSVEHPEEVRALERSAAATQHMLDAVEEDLSSLQQQQRALAADGDVAGRAAGIVAPNRRPPCIQWAAAYLSRLTAGRYVDLCVTPEPHELQIIDEHGDESSWRSASRGLLAQVALSLRLALVRAYAEKGVRFPLVFDDVLVDCDVERLQEAVALLRDFADEHGQQVLYLTCGSHAVSLFESAGAVVRTLPAAASSAPGRGQANETSANWSVQGWIDRRPSAVAATERPVGETRPERTRETSIDQADALDLTLQQSNSTRSRQTDGAPLDRRQPGEPFWLSVDSSLLHVPSIGEQMGRRLSALGIRTVSDLLDLTAEESSIPLRSLQVDVGRLREWQAEARLLTCVPDLTAPDAQLLVACGVCDPHQLAECDVAQLIQRLDRLSRRNRESQLDASLPTREDLQRWIHSSRRSRSLDDARRVRRGAVRSRRGRDVAHRMLPAPRRAAATVQRGLDTREEDRAVVGRVVPRVEANPGSDAAALRFYLNPESSVVDAPSIGPKMASRLEKLGIKTVADLLAWQPAAVAERLKNRRVNAHTVSLWQQQARLMCRIPQLRGHDVQVLVACDITEPEQVAGMDARTLFGIVGPFVETTEGQRLLRSSKSPDLKEVAEWITWANQARPLRAA
ncbi:MAG: DUF4332 domain-containing protein [Planctomycetaceae bacterium]